MAKRKAESQEEFTLEGEGNHIQNQQEVENTTRPARVRMGAGRNLEYTNTKEGFHYHWIEDNNGRIEKAQAAYYEFVVEGGEKVRRASGNRYMYLMCLTKELYEEDMKWKREQNIDTLKKENSLAEGEYIPDDRKSAVSKDEIDDPLR